MDGGVRRQTRSANRVRRQPSQSVPAPIRKKAAVVVLGMHRSGTSALTRVLNLLGCDLPKTLLPASPGDNDLGFWESKVVMDLNNEILESAGSNWDDWTPFNAAWYDSPVSHGFYDRALTVLGNEFGSSYLFVLKDPRVCRLLRFWVEALKGFGAIPLIVVPVRNPLEVAKSLNKRNGIDPSTAHLIWLRHTLEAEAASRHLTRSYVRYDGLLTSWQSVADKLGHDLKIAWPKDLVSAAASIEEFLSSSLRHHHEADSGVVKNPSFSLWIQKTFEILSRWAQGTTRESDFDDLDQIREAFDTATTAFVRPLNAGRQAIRKNRELERGFDEAQKLTVQSKAELDVAIKATADLRNKLTQAEAALTQRAREADDVRRQLAELREQWAHSKSEAEAAVKAGVELRDRLAQTESALAQRRHEAEETAAGLAGAREELRVARTAAEETSREKTAEIEKLKAEIVASRSASAAEKSKLEAQVSERFAEIAILSRQHQDNERKLVDTKHKTHAQFRRAVRELLARGDLPQIPILSKTSFWRGLVLRRKAALLGRSGLVDVEWYLRHYQDVTQAGMDPLEHYIAHGVDEGRAPNSDFER